MHDKSDFQVSLREHDEKIIVIGEGRGGVLRRSKRRQHLPKIRTFK